MNNENFSIQSTLEGNYLLVTLQEPVLFDEIAMNVINSDCPPFLIPFKVQNFNDRISLKYKLINTIALEYMELNCTKKEFVKLYQNLLAPFVKGSDWFLDYHNFCLDPRYIYVDKMYEVSYVYVPEKNYVSREEDIIEFFKNVFSRSNIKDDADFQVKLFQYFARNSVSLVQLYEMMAEENKFAISVGKSAGKIGENSLQNRGGTEPGGHCIPPRNDMGMNNQQEFGQVISKTPDIEKKAEDTGAKSNEKNSGKKGVKTGLFGGKAKKEKNVDVFALESDEPSLESNDEAVIEALFGEKNSGKENKKKVFAQQEKKEKSSSGLFGMKKKNDGKEKVSVAAGDRGNSGLNGNLGIGGNSGLNGNMPDGKRNQMPGEQVSSPLEEYKPHYQSFTGDFGFGSETESDETEILENESGAAKAYLELVDSVISGALPYISLDFDTKYITIGRTSHDEIQPDVAFSREFKQMGRRHARIEKNNGKYYVIDLGSANHTILNGRVLVPNQMYELTDGGELIFTDSKPVRYRIHL